MLFKNELKYLNGEEFDNGLEINIPYNKLSFRNSYLENLAKGKKNIHIGFVDHIPLIEKKIKNDNWLHGKLSKVSKKCVGLDINKGGGRLFENKL